MVFTLLITATMRQNTFLSNEFAIYGVCCKLRFECVFSKFQYRVQRYWHNELKQPVCTNKYAHIRSNSDMTHGKCMDCKKHIARSESKNALRIINANKQLMCKNIYTRIRFVVYM